MELPVYEGGSGGKFRRQSFRRPATTPYDRPPSAARGMRRLETDAISGRGWLWKLVDPASRFIAGSTSRIFSTMFRKRLLAPTKVQGLEQNTSVKLYVPDAIDAPTELALIQEVGHNQSKNFETSEMSEIEQLLKQKKYTRAQVDYLTKLICSRTFEPIVQESKSNNEKVNYDERNEERSTSLNRMLSTPQTPLSIPLDVAASPAEIAKAYMSSRLPKGSSSALSLQSQVFQKDKSLPSSGVLTRKQDDLPAVPRSVLHIPEFRNLSGVGYPTLKPRGRSSMYRMSRSPYFNVNPTLNEKVSEYMPSTNVGPASSQWPSGSTSISGSRQVLKRGSSFLDREEGSFGPIRRIRQKSGLIFNSVNPRFMPSREEDLKDPTSSEKPGSPNELKCSNTGLQYAEHEDGKLFASNFPPVPRQSSEACRKILEQLDKFAPSREEKSNIRSVSIDESPSRLTTEMLNGPARRSMYNVDTCNFTNMDVIDTSAYRNTDDLQEVEGSQSEKAGKELENGPSRIDSPGLKFASAANGISKQAIFNNASSPSLIPLTGTTNSVPARVLSQRKPSFQMSAPEDLLELDDEQDAVVVSAKSTLSMVKTDSKTAGTDAPIFASAPENPLLSPSKNLNVTIPVPLSESSKKASEVSQISAKESSFRFPASTESSGLSNSALTPSMSFQSHEKPFFQNEETLPTFMFDSRNSGTNSPSLATTAANESPIESKAGITWLGTKVQSEGLNMFNDGKSKASLHKSPEIVASSGGTVAIAFGTSVISTQSNGSVNSSSVSSVASASTPETIPTTQINLFSSNSKLKGASPDSPPISTTSPVLPSAATFCFGAAASTSTPVSVSILSDKSISVHSDGNVANDSPFGSSNPTTTHAAFVFSNTGSSNASLMGSSTFPDLGSTPSSKISTSTPLIFSQVSSSGSGFAAPTSFSSGTNGIFGSNTAQSSSIVFSAANSSFPNSSTNFGTTGGSLFGVQPSQFGSGTSLFSQSLTSQPGSGSFSSAALGSNSSSLSSPSTFGQSSSSSPGFGQVSFGTTNQTAKSFGSSSGFSFTSGASHSSISGFSFGTTAPASGVSSFGFGPSSSGSVFSFTSSGVSPSATTSTPIFGMPSTSGCFSSISPNNDQMNVEDTMADDTNQAPGPIFPTFGQPNSVPASSNFVFGSAVPSGGTSVFQFGSQQNSSTLQNPNHLNPFQAGGGVDFNPGGSFSLGSGGGDKSARKIVKIKRDKIRRK
ncbi:hypothetical protein KSP39_PZI002865 [Platanthera zijinensis]|uniref:Nuclear pore complex protein n=1 Tax=Platanthera zijinensis TaxID=2320716 RepID=A0AAP0C111_9ASPA